MGTSFLFSDQLAKYIDQNWVREPAILAELRAETAAMPQSQMQISAEEGAFLSLLVKLIGAKNALEVGVFTGYSSLATALAMPPEGKIIACDVSEEFTSMARRYWQRAGVAGKIDLRLAPALETLDGLLGDGRAGHFDLAFIDADKPNYKAYYERCLKLLRPGGLIAIDNVLWSGKVADPAADDADTVAIRELNTFLHADDRIDLALAPVGDGVTLAVRR